jgi:putative spermidine/putrescine transport system permease protein
MSAVARNFLYSGRHRRPRWADAWPLYPVLVFLLLFFALPVGELLWTSFFNVSGEFSLENYARLITTPVYLRVIGISFKIAAWTTLFTLIAAYPVAYLIATVSEARRYRLLLLVLLPFWTSFLVKTLAWMILLGRNGAVNELLVALGITKVPLELIYNFFGVMVGMIHGMLPLAVLTMVPVMLDIDQNLIRAAHTMGAAGGQSFWRIYFPLSLPGVAAAGLLVFITSLGFFVVPALLGGARETMISQVIISTLLELMNWRFAGALALVLLVVTVFVFYLCDRLLGAATFTGEGGSGSEGNVRRGGLVSRLGTAIGMRIIATFGGASDAMGAALKKVFGGSQSRAGRSIPRALLIIVASLLVAFMLVPTLFVIPVSFTAGSFMSLPPQGLSFRWYHVYLDSPTWWNATMRSLSIATATGLLATILGTGAAFVLARQRVSGRVAIMGLVLAPLILPRIITAVALFYLFARLGLVGTELGLVLGHTTLAVPSVMVAVLAVMRGYDVRQDQAAWSLGANRWKAFYYITLPQIRPGLLAAFLFAFVTSFDDLTVALFVSGGSSATLPKQMWNDLLLQVNPTLAAVSTVVLAIATILILLAESLRRKVSRYTNARPTPDGTPAQSAKH